MDTQTNGAAPVRVAVRAMLHNGAPFRMRAGRKFTEAPVTLTVTDAPATPDEITPAQYQALVEDRYIAVSAVGGTDPQIPSLKAAMNKAESEVTELRKQLEAAAESARVDRELAAQQAADLGARIVALESELAAAKSQLAERARKAK